MSIWVSRWPLIGFDEHPEPDEPQPQGGQVRSYATGWGNHYPTTDGQVEREAQVCTAHIPSWCVPGHQDNHLEEGTGSWLRLDVATHEHNYHAPPETTGRVFASVVLDEAAVRALVADLTEWLSIPKVRPTGPSTDLPVVVTSAAADAPHG